MQRQIDRQRCHTTGEERTADSFRHPLLSRGEAVKEERSRPAPTRAIWHQQDRGHVLPLRLELECHLVSTGDVATRLHHTGQIQRRFATLHAINKKQKEAHRHRHRRRDAFRQSATVDSRSHSLEIRVSRSSSIHFPLWFRIAITARDAAPVTPARPIRHWLLTGLSFAAVLGVSIYMI